MNTFSSRTETLYRIQLRLFPSGLTNFLRFWKFSCELPSYSCSIPGCKGNISFLFLPFIHSLIHSFTQSLIHPSIQPANQTSFPTFTVWLLNTSHHATCWALPRFLSLHLGLLKIFLGTIIVEHFPGVPWQVSKQLAGCPPSLSSSCLLPLCVVLCDLPHSGDRSFILFLLVGQVTSWLGSELKTASPDVQNNAGAQHFLCHTTWHACWQKEPKNTSFIRLFKKPRDHSFTKRIMGQPSRFAR